MELAQWVLNIYSPIMSHRPFLSKIDFRIFLHFDFIYFFLSLKLEPLERYSKCVLRASTYKSGVQEYNLCRGQEEGRKTPIGRFQREANLSRTVSHSFAGDSFGSGLGFPEPLKVNCPWPCDCCWGINTFMSFHFCVWLGIRASHTARLFPP